MSRVLRFSAGLYVSLLLAPPLFPQDGPPKQRVRFVDGKVEFCEVVATDADGPTLRLENIPKAVKFKWWQIDPEDVPSLRGGPSTPAATPAGLGPALGGLRVRTRENRVLEGVALPGAPPNVLRLKNAEGTFDIPRASIEKEEEIRIEVSRVYSPDELFSFLMNRLRPSTPEEFDRLGAELLRLKLQDRALAVFKMAELLRRPEGGESRLYRDLARLRERLADITLQRLVYNVQESTLVGEYQAALEQIDALEGPLAEAKPGEEVLKELSRLRALLQELRGVGRDARIVDEWYRAIDAFVKSRALDRSAAYADAVGFVERTLPGEVLRHVSRRFNFGPGDDTALLVWDRRPADAVYKHAYDEASWAVLRPEARDPATWWSEASDAARYKLLKGLFVERHLKVVQTDAKSCGACGGTGQVDPLRRPDALGGVCPGCQGVKAQRVLIYR